MKPIMFFFSFSLFCGPLSVRSKLWYGYPHGSEVSKLFVAGSRVESRRLLGALPLLVGEMVLKLAKVIGGCSELVPDS